ncbi:MAG: peptidyl-prolyl cis-trans isomerase [Bacteriovoracaceae bacterium]|nr:peptidyl-prolyl cis-trans isomerase [Bacteriovoracaceae bacterium]
MFKVFSALILTTCLMSHSFAASPVVVMQTSHGTIEIELNEEKAPESVKNFLKYVDDKFYDGTIFHRVISSFMIQGGGFTPKMEQKKTRAAIKNEAGNGLTNDVGTIAMARTSEIHSATSQFFINVENNTMLNHRDNTDAGFGYAVFGKVTSGMHVVNRIKAVRTGNRGGHGDVPMDNVVIKNVRRK